MISLPRLDTPAHARILAKYRSAVDERPMPLFGNERSASKVVIDAAFALGITCGIELERLNASSPREEAANA